MNHYFVMVARIQTVLSHVIIQIIPAEELRASAGPK